MNVKSVSAPICPGCRTRMNQNGSGLWGCATCIPAEPVSEPESAQTRDERIQVTVTADEKARISAAARRERPDASRSSWCRDVILDRLDEIGV